MKAQSLSKYVTRRFAAATYGLIILNVAIFIGTLNDPAGAFARYGLVPAHLSLLSMFTGMFIHSDIIHLTANMLFLWLFGRSVEFAMGGVEYVVFYIGSGFAAAIVHVAIIAAFALDPTVPAVGASGAIAGVLGVYAVRFYRTKFKVGQIEIPALIVLFGWLLVQAVLGFVSLWMTTYNVLSVQVNFRSVGYWSHIGGFVFGMVVAQLTRMDVQGMKDYLRDRARNSMERGTLLDVVRCHEELSHYDPTDPFAQAELGRAWALLDDREQSLPCYQKAIALYLRSGMGDDALRRFGEMRYFWPGAKLDPPTQFRLAGYLEEAGRYSDAVDALNRLVSESPDSVEAQMALLKAGQIRMTRLSDSGGAAEAFNRLLKNYPGTDWRRFAQDLIGRTKKGAAQAGGASSEC